jgi:rhodanese-related sulfurtransferase
MMRVWVFCAVYETNGRGIRLGAQKLADAGFTKVYRLAGEYKAWVAAGLPIEK